MTIDKLIVIALGVALNIIIYWFFLGKKDSKNENHHH